MGWITKGNKKINVVPKTATGKIIFQNEMGESMGSIDFRAQADSNKIRNAKMLKITSEVDGKPLESKEIKINDD